MSSSDGIVTWRPELTGALLETVNAVRRAAGEPPMSTGELETELEHPDAVPHERLLLVLDGDDVAGYAHAWVDDRRRVTMKVGVEPPRRRRGVGGRLFAESVARLPHDAGPVEGSVSAADEESLRFATARGLRPSYVSLWMAADADAVPPPGEPPPAVTIRSFRPADREPLRRVHNEAFAETPRFRGITEDAMGHWVTTRYFDPAGVQVAEAADGTLVGYVWCDVVREEWEARRERTGYVGLLGVHARGRRTGLGEHLLRRGVAWLRSAGCDVAELDVWLDNANALRLYERNGFRVLARRQWLSAPLSAVRSSTTEAPR